MTLLVTGAAGLIGWEVVKQLAAAGEKVIASDVRPPAAALPDGVTFAGCDISIFNEFLDMVRECKPTRIYHFAAMLTGLAEERHQLAFQVNVVGAHNVLEAARICAVPQVLYVSSNGIYGRDLAEVIDDYSLQRPNTFYGCSKVFGENLGRWYQDRFKLDFRTIRYPLIIAPGDRAAYHWVAPMIEDALVGRPHLCVEGVSGSNAHMMTVTDAARAAIALAAAPREQLKTYCYSVLGVPRPVMATEMAAELEKLYPGFKVEFAKKPSRQPPVRRFSDKYAREEWGWQPAQDDIGKVVAEFAVRIKN